MRDKDVSFILFNTSTLQGLHRITSYSSHSFDSVSREDIFVSKFSIFFSLLVHGQVNGGGYACSTPLRQLKMPGEHSSVTEPICLATAIFCCLIEVLSLQAVHHPTAHSSFQTELISLERSTTIHVEHTILNP